MKHARKMCVEAMLRETMARERMAHYVSSFCRHTTVNSGSSWHLVGVAPPGPPRQAKGGLVGDSGDRRNRAESPTSGKPKKLTAD
jgi:hypothetical protein